MTKEELIAENIRLKQIVEKFEDGDKGVRADLSKILHAPRIEMDSMYSDPKPQTYSWLEITAEIGKLLATKTDRNLEEKVDSLMETYDENFREVFNRLDKLKQ